MKQNTQRRAINKNSQDSTTITFPTLPLPKSTAPTAPLSPQPSLFRFTITKIVIIVVLLITGITLLYTFKTLTNIQKYSDIVNADIIQEFIPNDKNDEKTKSNNDELTGNTIDTNDDDSNGNFKKNNINIIEIKNNENYVGITDKNQLQVSTELSLSYILRQGHNERVYYLIGSHEPPSTAQDLNTISKLSARNKNIYDRNYNANPIKIGGWNYPPDSEAKCDVPCEPCGGACDTAGIRWSMENVGVSESPGYISGSTRLNSQVPVPYFSWHDFGFMLPPKDLHEKDHTDRSLAAAFISNCGFPKRNNLVTDLQKYGVVVHSYGRCVHNKEEDQSRGRDNSKVSLLQTYKFSLAFENSETDDYITEKFFQSLVSGSVPVYIGAPNVKFFAPDSGPYPYTSQHSVIYTGDFDFNAEKIAKYLLYLDSNNTAYNEYLSWKTKGYSGDFKAMVDLTSTHTACRQCVLAADRVRQQHGITAYDDPINTYKFGNGKKLYIRERGLYRYTLIQLKENTLADLIQCILISLKKNPINMWKTNEHPYPQTIKPAVYAIYHASSKITIHSDEAIKSIQDDVELEVILL